MSSRNSSRHSTSSRSPQGSLHRSDGKHLNLTAEDRFLIARTWNDDFNVIHDLALTIYEDLFSQNPDIAAMFPGLDPKHLETRGNKQFAKMAMRLVRILATAVRHLNDEHPLDVMLDSLGEQHRAIISRGLKPEHWDMMNGAIIRSIEHQIRENDSTDRHQLTDCQIDKSVVAWGKLVDYITQRIKFATYQGLSDDIITSYGSFSCSNGSVKDNSEKPEISTTTSVLKKCVNLCQCIKGSESFYAIAPTNAKSKT